ncbi:hypothetical protein, partial [Frankia sp. R82]|uniref:hypothetical protein n=1 Tax=Frankia sp. R82 TaxID=2950553 RepID=UPI0020441A08
MQTPSTRTVPLAHRGGAGLGHDVPRATEMPPGHITRPVGQSAVAACSEPSQQMTGTGAVGFGGEGQAVPTGTLTEVVGQDFCGGRHWSALSRTEPSGQVTLTGCWVGGSAGSVTVPQVVVAAGASTTPPAGRAVWLGQVGEFPWRPVQFGSTVWRAAAEDALGQVGLGQSVASGPSVGAAGAADPQGRGEQVRVA